MEVPVWAWVAVTLGAAAISAAGPLIAHRQSQKARERERAADRMHERELRDVEEVRRVAPAFADTVYSLKLRLDEIVSYYTGLIIARAGEDTEEWLKHKIAAALEEVTADRVTALHVRLWQVQVACGADAASTAEEIAGQLRSYFGEVKSVQMSKLLGSSGRLHEHGDRCSELSKQTEALLRRFATQTRATTWQRDG